MKIDWNKLERELRHEADASNRLAVTYHDDGAVYDGLACRIAARVFSGIASAIEKSVTP